MKNFVHLINNEKFTKGYILFMQEQFSNYNHIFITTEGMFTNENNLPNVYIIKKWREIKEKDFKRKMLNADKIIVSGVFGVQLVLFLMSRKIMKKVFLQFWGGDFYNYKNKGMRVKILKIIQYITILRSAGIINLIPNDYNELKKIFPNKKKHFVCAVMGPDKTYNIYKRYLNKPTEEHKIVVGNSSVLGNGQLEVFEMLKKYKDENIKIVCPLSYGNPEFRDKIIKKGKEIFGNKFEPITKFMNFDEYNSFLASTEVGIFNNNRQQAMGNISLMIKLGKKVYIRKNTPMWESYTNDGLKVYDINEISNLNSFEQLFSFNKEIGLKNEKKFVERRKKDIERWKIFFDS